MVKYKSMRIPETAYNNFLIRKVNIENAIKELTGKHINIPLTKVITTVSSVPITISDDYLLDIARKKKRVVRCIKINTGR